MDIDKLFKVRGKGDSDQQAMRTTAKVPKIPIGGNKRKLPDNPAPEMLKKMRVDVSASDTSEKASVNNNPNSQNAGLQEKSRSRSVTIQDEDDVDMPTDFAPGGDADYFVEEDEEGRFFGGGLTAEQKDILNIFDHAGGDGVQEDMEDLSITAVRRILLRFERAVNKNQDQRSKYPDDPSKFIDSEADLDTVIKSLLPLSQVPLLAYPELIRSGTVALLIGLLSHENADIVIDIVEVLHELTDEDVGNEAEQEDEEEGAASALRALIDALIDNSMLDLLVSNLARLNEVEEADRQGVFHILGIFENILGVNPKLATQFVSKTTILSWLLQRIESKTHDENRGYAAEMLSILIQDNRQNRLELGKKDGIETLLKVVSQYRKRDPTDADEMEFMENVFDSLCSALSESQNKTLFLASEGVDLMILMMKEKLQSRLRAVKTLDFAMSGAGGPAICEAFVEALGLRTLFPVLMGKTHGKKNKSGTALPASEDTSHILGMLSSLFTNLASDSPYRIRLLAKFAENNYEKVDRLLDIRENAQNLLRTVDAGIEREKKVLEEEGEEIAAEEKDAWYLRRLDGGLFTLQTVDYILAWIAMEDDGVRAHEAQMLSRKNKSLGDIIRTLQIYHDNIGDDTLSDADSGERDPLRKEILHNLMLFLKSC